MFEWKRLRDSKQRTNQRFQQECTDSNVYRKNYMRMKKWRSLSKYLHLAHNYERKPQNVSEWLVRSRQGHFGVASELSIQISAEIRILTCLLLFCSLTEIILNQTKSNKRNKALYKHTHIHPTKIEKKKQIECRTTVQFLSILFFWVSFCELQIEMQIS